MAGTVVLGGTPTPLTNKPTVEGHSVLSKYAQNELNAQSGLQNDDDFFQEVSAFIGEMSRVLVISPRAAITRTIRILSSMLTQGPLN